MSVKSVDITISEDLVPYLYTIRDGKTISDKLTLSAVVGLFAAKVITLEKAAELIDKSIWDFVDILKTLQIPWGECEEEGLKMDAAAIEKLEAGCYE